MKTVLDFYDTVMYNENHKIRIKSGQTDLVLAYFEDYEGLEKSGYKDSVITGFATDWENKIYILWV